MKTGREAAAAALLQMEQQQAYSHLLSANGFSLPDPRERAFGRALFWGVLERMLTLDAILAPCLSKPLSKQDPAVRCLLRLGAYQLYYTRVPDNAAVYETVELAKKMGRSRQSGFINGVLRQLIRGGKQIPYPKEDPLVYDSLFYSCPLWLVRMWHRQYGQQAARQMLSASIGAAPLYGRVNTLRIQPKALVELLAEQGLSAVSVGAEETRAPGERRLLRTACCFPILRGCRNAKR